MKQKKTPLQRFAFALGFITFGAPCLVFIDSALASHRAENVCRAIQPGMTQQQLILLAPGNAVWVRSYSGAPLWQFGTNDLIGDCHCNVHFYEGSVIDITPLVCTR